MAKNRKHTQPVEAPANPEKLDETLDLLGVEPALEGEPDMAEEQGLNAPAVAELLDQAREADVERVAEQVAVVTEQVAEIQSDVVELQEAIAPTAPLDPVEPPPAVGSGTLQGVGSLVPVLVNGRPATPEESKKAYAALERARRHPAGRLHTRS